MVTATEKYSFVINIKGELVDLSTPRIMGILNITPDSFFAESRKQTESEIVERIYQLREEKADFIDVGGYSSRPNAVFVDETEEMKRLDFALPILFREYPEAIVSVDTFRSEIARKCVLEHGVSIINDISAGEMDPKMFDTMAELNVPYILMHMRGTPQTMMQYTQYEDFRQETFLYFAEKINLLRLKGVNDLIIDPGFGFSKTIEQNYALLNGLNEFSIFELPILAGLSRKTMIWKVLNCDPDHSLNGTSVLNMIALQKGAHILRVHDVKEAVEVVTLYKTLKENIL